MLGTRFPFLPALVRSDHHRARVPSAAPDESDSSRNPEPDLDPDRPVRVSPKLSRWSRARSIRSGRTRVDWPALRKRTASPIPTPSPSSPASLSPPGEIQPSVAEGAEMDGDDGGDNGEMTAGKAIYMVSDGTGWTAEHSVNAALGQFEHCLVDRGCPVNTHLFSGVFRLFTILPNRPL